MKINSKHKIWIILIIVIISICALWINSRAFLKPTANEQKELINKILGMKVQEASSIPIFRSSIGLNDSTYLYIFDADKAWKNKLIKRFGMTENSQLKASWYYSYFAMQRLYPEIETRISQEQYHRMIAYEANGTYKGQGQAWTISFLMDPESTLCCLQIHSDSMQGCTNLVPLP